MRRHVKWVCLSMLLRKFLPYQLNVKKVSKAVNMQQKENILHKPGKVKFTPYQHLNFNYTEMAPNLPKYKQGIIGKIMSCLQNSWMFIFCTKWISNERNDADSRAAWTSVNAFALSICNHVSVNVSFFFFRARGGKGVQRDQRWRGERAMFVPIPQSICRLLPFSK